jgi:predicted ArsR family transcriptional regulator
MKSTRQRVLEVLAGQRTATAREISHLLQITPADARHHLANLLQEGAVVPVGNPSGEGRGRPAQRYSLASLARHVDYELLAPALLVEALARIPAPGQESFLRAALGRLAGERKPSGNLTARLVSAIQRLNELGYAARWEARLGGPHLILERQPFAGLSAQHAAAADLDIYLLEALLGSPVRRIDGGNIYVVGKTQ